ncbi:XRE family transcriptional regulator [Diaphorobacter caeni]|uniref:XRE family transcriptional regulator n=1 Tax=Diaphorobacter caeni TaxID=2784387 RepID=UPI001E4F773D|nr:XRE family transcriptional regulator [Diaphorobacter caeni]
MSQTTFGEVGGVTKKTQMLYEGGERTPDASYLAAAAGAGVDVRYVVTGQRDAPAQDVPSPEEKLLLQYYREAAPAIRKAALAALLSGSSGNGMHMSGLGDGNVQIGAGGRLSGSVNVHKGK